MPEYVLSCGEPQQIPNRAAVRFETKRLRRNCPDDKSAIEWAREAVRRDFGVVRAAGQHPAVPLILWLIEADGRAVIWEWAAPHGDGLRSDPVDREAT